jgi:hypothetical protein
MVHDRGLSVSIRVRLNMGFCAHCLSVAVRGAHVTVVVLDAGLCTVLWLSYFSLLTISSSFVVGSFSFVSFCDLVLLRLPLPSRFSLRFSCFPLTLLVLSRI